MALIDQTLKGTLEGTTPKAIALDDSEDSGFAFRSLMRQMGQLAVQQQPSPMEKLRNFKEVTGLEAQTAGAIGGVLEGGEKERLMGITEHFRTAMDAMREKAESKKEEQRRNYEFGKMMFNRLPAEALGSLTGDDLENIKIGHWSEELQERLKPFLEKEEESPERKAVENLFRQYPDAGISLKDSVQDAQAKLRNSAIYRKQISTGSVGSGVSVREYTDDEGNIIRVLSDRGGRIIDTIDLTAETGVRGKKPKLTQTEEFRNDIKDAIDLTRKGTVTKVEAEQRLKDAYPDKIAAIDKALKVLPKPAGAIEKFIRGGEKGAEGNIPFVPFF